MNKEKFEALLPLIIASLLNRILTQRKVSEDEAFSWLYNSNLYILLNDEQTKVWHYSVEKLFQLFEEEMTTGKIELPEY